MPGEFHPADNGSVPTVGAPVPPYGAYGPSEPTLHYGEPQYQQYPGMQQYPEAHQFPPQAAPAYGQNDPYGNPYGATAAHAVPGGGYGPPVGGAPGGPPMPPPRNRTNLIIGAIAAVVVVAVVAVVLIVVLTGGDDKAGSAKEAVNTYLHALADGDAEKALSVIKTPPATTLLTDDILKRQQGIAKITDIKVFDGDGPRVKATYKFGQRNADVDVFVSKSGGDWQLTNGALEIDPTYIQVPDPTLFGVDVSNESKVYVFPGPLVWGSKNQYVTVTDEGAADFPLGPELSASVSTSKVTPALNEAGTTAVSTAINTYLTNCEGSREADASVDRPGCEQNSYSSARPGTVRWTKPTDLSRLDVSFGYDDDLKVRVSGIVEWQVTYVPTYDDAPRTSTDTEFMHGKVDLGQNPPTYLADS